MTKPVKPKAQAPKGRNNSAQGSALGNAATEDQSPEGARPSVALPSGWRLTTVDESIQIIDYRGRTPPFDGDSIPHLRSQNVKSGRIVWHDLAYVSEATYAAFMTRGIPKSGDILFTTEAPLGEVAPVPEERFSVAQRIMVLRPSAELWSPLFLMYQLMSPEVQARIRRKGTGSTVTGVASRNFKPLELRVAPLDDQRRIVAEIEKQFTRLEAGVAALRRVQANLKRYRAAVLKAACEGRLVPTEAELARAEGRPFESGKQLLARILTERRQNWQGRGKYKEPEAPDEASLPTLPKGWVWCSVEQLGDVQLGRQRSPKNVSKNYPTKYIRAANITERGIDVLDVLEMEFSPAERERFALRDGDVVLSEASGSPSQVGKPAIWRGELPLCCFQNTVLRLRPLLVRSKYVLTTFLHFYVNSVFAKVAGGVGINHLGAEKFSAIPFPLPPLAEQTRIVAEVERRLSVVEELEAVATTNLQRATRLRQSILQKAFTGELTNSG